jgi:hypothetical protein
MSLSAVTNPESSQCDGWPSPLTAGAPNRLSMRSAITVAGIAGQACSNSRIRGSTAATDPVECRRPPDTADDPPPNPAHSTPTP